MATAAETFSVVAGGAAVAMAVADNSRNAGADNIQQNVAGGSGSGGDSNHGSSNHCSMAAAAARGDSTAEVTTMRAAATATNTPIYPWVW
jgi:hypothetical protein